MPEDNMDEELDQEETTDLQIQGELPQFPLQTPVIVQPPKTTDRPTPEAEEEDPREDLTDLTQLDDYDRNWTFGTSGVIESEEEDDISDLVDVSDEDIMGEGDTEDITGINDEEEDQLYDVTSLTEEMPDEDFSDLVDVTQEDIMGEAPKPRYRALPRTRRPRQQQPPSSLGGIRA